MTLSTRIEQAGEGSRELDAEIAVAIFGGSLNVCGRFWKPGVRGFSISPHYTTSLDAAMTLFVDRPDFISTNPRKVCAAALKARGL